MLEIEGKATKYSKTSGTMLTLNTAMMPVMRLAMIAVPITFQANTSITVATPIAAQRGASTYLRPCWNSQRVCVSPRPPRHEDEYRRDDENGSAKHPEQQLGEPNTFGFTTEFLRYEPIDRAHEAHEQPNDQGVDMKNFGNVEVQQTEE